MKIAILGSGGREHALALQISKSPKLKKLYCIPGNAGTNSISENIKLDIALKWMNKAMEMTENPQFFQLRQQSLIMAANGDYKDAIEVAKKSLELSIEADNQDYVKMNNESIDEWSKKF